MKTWRTIVVFGVPAIITLVLWWGLGSQLNATLSAAKFNFFGTPASLEAVGPTAVYFCFLVIAAWLNPLEVDELMPLRKQLRGVYKATLTGCNPQIKCEKLTVAIDKKSRRLSISGKSGSNAIVVDSRIVLNPDYFAFVMEIQKQKYFVECSLMADSKSRIPESNQWSRLDSNGFGSIEIQKIG